MSYPYVDHLHIHQCSADYDVCEMDISSKINQIMYPKWNKSRFCLIYFLLWNVILKKIKREIFGKIEIELSKNNLFEWRNESDIYYWTYRTTKII